MSDKTYRTTWVSHFHQAWPILLYALAMLALPIYMRYAHGLKDLRFETILAAVFFSLVFIPHLLIHLRYTLVTAGLSVAFSGDQETIVINSPDEKRVIKVREIERVELVVPRSLARHELFVYPWQIYGYAIFTLTSGEQFLITSLLLPGMEFPFELPNVITQERLYCWPPTPTRSSGKILG